MGASMKETWFLVMTWPLTLAAMPLTSMGPPGAGAGVEVVGRWEEARAGGWRPAPERERDAVS